MEETDQPEDEDKYDEKYGIDHPHEGLADLAFHLSILFLGPGFPGLILFPRVLCQRLPVGLHQDVHEGFEETEDQPDVHQLQVGGWGGDRAEGTITTIIYLRAVMIFDLIQHHYPN